MKTLKLLGMLLSYPTTEMQQHSDDIIDAIATEGLIPTRLQKPLFEFILTLSQRNLTRVQEDYVALFDRSRAHSLYLFEHVHGESRDRGQAMVDLMGLYKSHGFTLSQRELPDYLPLFLEFLSVQPFNEAQELLAEIAHIVAAIGAKLKAKKSGYHQIFRVLEAISNTKVDTKFVEDALFAASREDNSLEALDKEWEDTPAFNGIGAADCAVCPSSTKPHSPVAGQQ